MSHNGIVMNFLLFNISHWSDEKLNELDEIRRIQSINQLNQEMIYFNYDQIDFSISDLNQLVDVLSKMISLTQKMAVYDAHLGPEIVSNGEQNSWIIRMENIYDQICEKICPDYQCAQKLISFVQGNPEYRHEAGFLTTQLCNQRFSSIAKAVLNENFLTPTNFSVPQMNLNVANLLNIIKSEFCCNNSLKTQLENIFRTQKYSPVLEKVEQEGWKPFYIAHSYKNQIKRYNAFVWRYFECGKKFGHLLKRNDISFLVLMNILLANTSDKQAQKMSEFCYKMLLMKIVDYEEFQSFETREEAAKLIFDGFKEFGGIMHSFTNECNSQPEEQACS